MDGFCVIATKATPETGDETIRRMVKAIIVIMEAQEDCLPHELVEKGFSLEQINRFWAKAKALAAFEVRASKR
jgi:hypothetical protein